MLKQMRIRVLYFGALKESAGRAGEELELPAGARVSDVLAQCRETIPALARYEKSVAVSVNQEFAREDVALAEGDEVALLPPVSGGNGGRCRMVREPIDGAAITGELKRPEDGALSVFDGIVRNNTRRRHTLYLEYEAYEPMALKQMEELAARAIANLKVRDVRIVHRLGRLEIGETSVLIAVASAHRAAAMDACRWLIDSLKKTVPIWKKEFFVDGAVWADGEPFPDEIRAAGASREQTR